MRRYLISTALGLLLLFAVVGVVFGLAAEETGTKMKTTKYLIDQEYGATSAGTAIETNFDVFVGESSPVIQNAFIEVKGASSSSGSPQSIDLKIKQQSDSSYSNAKTFTFDVPSRSQHFELDYDITSYLTPVITTAGTYSFTLYMKNSGSADLNALQARAVITYSFTPPSASTGFRSSGYIVSSTFDTTNTNGAAPNSILWKGTLPSTSRVKFQFASSNCSNGATNAPTCNSGTWSYVGSDGTGATYYEPSGPDVALSIDLSSHNNKRYFKYKVILYPSNDSLLSPSVQDIILNWSQ